MFKILQHIFITASLAVLFQSCELDLLEQPGGEIPEGCTRVDLEMRFTPMEVAQMNAGGRSDGMVFEGEDGAGNDYTTAPDGNSMDPIRSLVILVYNTNNELQRDLSVSVDLTKYRPELENREPSDATNGAGVQEKTYCVKSPLTLPFGNYKIFAVANVDGLSPQSTGIETTDKLRAIQLQWSPSVAYKCPMFGYFTNEKADTRGMNLEGEAEVLVRPSTTYLHSWIRRAASKLTIDFDGSNLRENVTVFIKEARVYDVADGCYLGLYSAAGPAQPGSSVNAGFGITQSDYRIVYGPGTADDLNYENWPSVVRGSKLTSYKRNGKTVDFHDETAFCLPFFENMQGTGSMKYQDANFDGNVDHPDAGDFETDADGNPVLDENGSKKWLYDEAKDSKPYGTYVEVTGYYQSRNNDYVTSGPIKYRFMLGKDAKNNYDCERNHHYKLTLSFKGNGNDADWHVEYDETPGIHLPSPLYISYLYNHNMTMPLRVNTGGRKVKSIQVDVTSNNWAPYFDPDWSERPANDRLDYYREADSTGNYGAKYPWNGFLSLMNVSDTQNETDNQISYQTEYTDEEGLKVSRGSRQYSVDPGQHVSEAYGTYSITSRGNVIEMQVPLYTRAKQLVKGSAYTGNNPYVGYPRKAHLKISVVLTDGSVLPAAETDVIQVRRIVNPKGVFRMHNNDETFHVVMKQLEKESSHSFENVISQGPWRAYVVGGDKNFITLDGKAMAEGTTRTPIDFNINFNGTIAADKQRFAVVRVEYHNYSCVHLIFVRQGEAPVKLYSDSPAWHTFNMKTQTEEVGQCVDEGSLFRMNRWDYPIDASNNNYSDIKDYWVNITPEDFKVQKTSYKMANNMSGGLVSWTTIGSGSGDATFPNTTVNKKTCGVATVQEFQDLRNATEQAYGVLYGDKATEVKSDLNEAYGYQRDEHGKADPTWGMRGCFAYVADSTKSEYGYSLFFPIGASGYGHRKHEGQRGGWGASEPISGTLRYAAGRIERYLNPKNPNALPLFYDLYKRPGALYWANKKGKVTNGLDNSDKMGLDINYFTFDFTPIDATSCFGTINGNKTPYNGSDACFIRCVDR